MPKRRTEVEIYKQKNMKKSILITGSTDGIGKLAAIKLAKDGHEVYLHGRNAEKLAAVIEEIKGQSGNENIKGFTADFSDMDAVKGMADQINNEVPNLDILINNAGVYKSSVPQNKAGFEMRFAVNYFAPFLLTNLLLPLLKKGTESRIINLSSAAQAPVSNEVLLGKQHVSVHESYAQSKLALTMWSAYLAKKEPELNVISVNPGSLLNTNMVREGFGFHRSSADKGGDILYDLAIAEKYEHSSGKYFDNDIGAFGTMHAYGSKEEAVQSLIENTNELLRSM